MPGIRGVHQVIFWKQICRKQSKHASPIQKISIKAPELSVIAALESGTFKPEAENYLS